LRARSSLLVVGAVALLPLAACEPSDPAVERISQTESGGAPNGRSYAPAISDDGRFVAFVSEANDIGGDPSPDRFADVFVHDREEGQTRALTSSGNGQSGRAPSCDPEGPTCFDSLFGGVADPPAISDDGRTVAFTSDATNFAGPVDASANVYVHRNGRIVLASRSSSGAPANGVSLSPSVSGNGRFVSFWSYADNLVPADTNASPDVFVRDLQEGTTRRANTTATGGQSGVSDEAFPISVTSGEVNVYAKAPLSDDGRYVAFLSMRTELVPGGAPLGNVYRKDLQTGAIVRISDPSTGNRAEVPWISGDGNLVSYRNGFWFESFRKFDCVSCFTMVTAAPPLRLVRNVSGGYNTELIPGTPFPSAPDVSGDGTLLTFAAGRDRNIYVRHLPTIRLRARHRINAGGGRFAGRFGKVWDADRGFAGGATRQVPDPIGFTADDGLYHDERYAMRSYELPVPDGLYRVRLLLSNLRPHMPPRPVFDVRAEGELVADDVDVRDLYFPFEATTVAFVVPVADGQLDLDFAAESGAPMVSAIEVLDARRSDRRISP
jgi:Tol biopolymer transport system component